MRRYLLNLACLVAVAAPAGAQQKIDQPGAYFHKAAGAVFPERVGEFVRSDVYRYDAEGRDVSASYNLVVPEGRLVVTVYIYPAPEVVGRKGETKEVARALLCAEHFKGTRSAITSAYGAAAILEDGRATAAGEVAEALSHRSVYKIRMRFDGTERDVRTEADLYCYVRDKWLVKYRASSPVEMPVEDSILQFIRTGPWPGRSAAAAVASR